MDLQKLFEELGVIRDSVEVVMKKVQDEVNRKIKEVDTLSGEYKNG